MLWILSGPDFEVMVISVQLIIFLEYTTAIKNLINFFFSFIQEQEDYCLKQGTISIITCQQWSL